MYMRGIWGRLLTGNYLITNSYTVENYSTQRNKILRFGQKLDFDYQLFFFEANKWYVQSI